MSGVMATRAGGRPSALIAAHAQTARPGRGARPAPVPRLSKRPSVSRCAPGPIRIWPGSAACWRRAATFTASPVGKRGVGGLGDHLAGLDADPRRQVDRFQDPERRLDGALGVVLVRLRHTERRHDRIAGELLHGAAVPLDARGDLVEELRHAAAHDLGVAGLDQAAGVDEVDEQDRGKLAFHSLIVETLEASPSFQAGLRKNGCFRRSSARAERRPGAVVAGSCSPR